MNADTTDRLQQIFRAVLKLPDGADVSRLAPDNTPAWDSLAHVMIVAAIESEFGASLDAGDQMRMTDYAATAALLAEKGL